MVEKIREIPTGKRKFGAWLRKLGKYQRGKQNLGRGWENALQKAQRSSANNRRRAQTGQKNASGCHETTMHALDPSTKNYYNPFTGCHGVCIENAPPWRMYRRPPPKSILVHHGPHIRPKIFRRIGCARARAKNNITKISNHGKKINKISNPLGFELTTPGDKGTPGTLNHRGAVIYEERMN